MELLTLGLCVGLLILLAYYYCHYPKGYPPGPPRVPLLGYFPFMREKSAPVDLVKLQNKYGDILSLKLGTHDCVVISSYDYMKKLLSDYACAFLPHLNMIYLAGGRHLDGEAKGIIFSEQETWSPMRKTIVSYLSSINTDKLQEVRALEKRIFFRVLEGIEGDAPTLFHELHKMTIRIVYRRLIVDKKMEDLNWDAITVAATKLMESEIVDLNIFNFLDFLLGLFVALKVDKMLPLGRHYDYLMSLSEECIDKHIDGTDSCSNPDMIDNLITGLRKSHENSDLSESDKKQIQYTLVTLVYTSGHNIVAIITWFMLRLEENPEVKRRVYEEVEANCNTQDDIVVEDKDRLPYTFAALMETYRMGMLFPCTLRRTDKEFTIDRYKIPFNTCVIFNNYAVMVDPKNYDDPMTFKPERFLGADSEEKLDVLKLKFGCGKRKCPALKSAAGDVFCIAVELIRKYNYEIKEDISTLKKYPVGMPPKFTARIFLKGKKGDKSVQ